MYTLTSDKLPSEHEYTCKVLARSVAAGSITEAQASANNPGFAGYVARRRAANKPITAQGWELPSAKPKSKKAAKSTPAPTTPEESNGHKPTLTKSQAQRMSKPKLATLVAARTGTAADKLQALDKATLVTFALQ